MNVKNIIISRKTLIVVVTVLIIILMVFILLNGYGVELKEGTITTLNIKSSTVTISNVK